MSDDAGDEAFESFFEGLDEYERERMRSHYFGPVDAGRDCLQRIAANDAVEAWALFAPAFKRFVAVRFLESRGSALNLSDLERTELVDQLAADAPDDPYYAAIWAQMMEDAMCSIRDDAGFDWVSHLNDGTLGAASATRPIPPHYEAVRYLGTAGEPVIYDKPTLVEALTLLLEPVDDRWLVNSFSETPATA